MEHKVTGCGDCPFACSSDRAGNFCGYKYFIGNGNFIESYIGDEAEELITPGWCPLNSESITITKQMINA